MNEPKQPDLTELLLSLAHPQVAGHIRKVLALVPDPEDVQSNMTVSTEVGQAIIELRAEIAKRPDLYKLPLSDIDRLCLKLTSPGMLAIVKWLDSFALLPNPSEGTVGRS